MFAMQCSDDEEHEYTGHCVFIRVVIRVSIVAWRYLVLVVLDFMMFIGIKLFILLDLS